MGVRGSEMPPTCPPFDSQASLASAKEPSHACEDEDYKKGRGLRVSGCRPIDFHLFLWLARESLLTVLGALASMFKTSAQLRLENIALRQQLAVLRRSAPKRLKLTPADRIFWVWLRRVWADWKSARMIVKAETVVAWHRKGFRAERRRRRSAVLKRVVRGCIQFHVALRHFPSRSFLSPYGAAVWAASGSKERFTVMLLNAQSAQLKESILAPAL
jgi:hypothetical protein